jgi:hypothetical protein
MAVGDVHTQSHPITASNLHCHSRRLAVVMIDGSGAGRNSPGTDGETDLQLPGLTVQRFDPGFALQAQLIGTLEIESRTNCLVVHKGGTFVDVAWPPGWRVAIRDGTIALIDASGQTASRLGDEVRVGGGFVDAERADIVSCTARKQVFLAAVKQRLGSV